MRRSQTALLLLMATFASTSSALEASDTMASWRNSSAKDKSEIVTRIIRRGGNGGQPAAIIRCLDKASGIPGHEDLLIAEVANACGGDGGEPV